MSEKRDRDYRPRSAKDKIVALKLVENERHEERKPQPQPKKRRRVSEPSPANWPCPRCTIANKWSLTKCSMCKGAKPVNMMETRALPVAPDISGSSGSIATHGSKAKSKEVVKKASIPVVAEDASSPPRSGQATVVPLSEGAVVSGTRSTSPRPQNTGQYPTSPTRSECRLLLKVRPSPPQRFNREDLTSGTSRQGSSGGSQSLERRTSIPSTHGLGVLGRGASDAEPIPYSTNTGNKKRRQNAPLESTGAEDGLLPKVGGRNEKDVCMEDNTREGILKGEGTLTLTQFPNPHHKSSAESADGQADVDLRKPDQKELPPPAVQECDAGDGIVKQTISLPTITHQHVASVSSHVGETVPTKKDDALAAVANEPLPATTPELLVKFDFSAQSSSMSVMQAMLIPKWSGKGAGVVLLHKVGISVWVESARGWECTHVCDRVGKENGWTDTYMHDVEGGLQHEALDLTIVGGNLICGAVGRCEDTGCLFTRILAIPLSTINTPADNKTPKIIQHSAYEPDPKRGGDTGDGVTSCICITGEACKMQLMVVGLGSEVARFSVKIIQHAEGPELVIMCARPLRLGEGEDCAIQSLHRIPSSSLLAVALLRDGKGALLWDLGSNNLLASLSLGGASSLVTISPKIAQFGTSGLHLEQHVFDEAEYDEDLSSPPYLTVENARAYCLLACGGANFDDTPRASQREAWQRGDGRRLWALCNLYAKSPIDELDEDSDDSTTISSVVQLEVGPPVNDIVTCSDCNRPITDEMNVHSESVVVCRGTQCTALCLRTGPHGGGVDWWTPATGHKGCLLGEEAQAAHVSCNDDGTILSVITYSGEVHLYSLPSGLK